jgi:hypothetical protein
MKIILIWDILLVGRASSEAGMRSNAMPEINNLIVADVYRRYTEARHDRQRREVLSDGVERILLRLKRYVQDEERFREKSTVAIEELMSYVNRFYHYDTRFVDRLIYEARAYLMEIDDRQKLTTG